MVSAETGSVCEEMFFRIDVASGAMKEIFYLKGFRLLERWIGLHPDGSLLVATNIGIQEIYALRLDRPLGRWSGIR